LTALVLPGEMEEWFPVKLQPVSHPYEGREPCRAALIQLDAGPYAVLFWGERSKMLMLQVAPTLDPTEFVSTLLQEVPLPTERIRWCRSHAYHPRRVRRVRRARR
jgi:hypothetical protein